MCTAGASSAVEVLGLLEVTNILGEIPRQQTSSLIFKHMYVLTCPPAIPCVLDASAGNSLLVFMKTKH